MKKQMFIFGREYFIKMIYQLLSKSINIAYQTPNVLKSIRDIYNSDYVYGILSGYDWKYWLIARIFNKRTICHWAGSNANFNQMTTLTRIKGYLSKWLIRRHLSASVNIHDILITCKLRLKTDIIPIYTIDRLEITQSYRESNNSQHKILMYIPENREKIYNINTMRSIINKYNNTNFIIIGRKEINCINNNNVTYCPILDHKAMMNIYNESTILIRITKNDGVSAMVQEFLCFGKPVIFNQDVPYVLYAQSYSQIIDYLHKLLNKKPWIDKVLQANALNVYTNTNYKNQLFKVMEK